MAAATAAGATRGGGVRCSHSWSSGPGNTLSTRTPAPRISARRHWASDSAAAFEADHMPRAGRFTWA